MTYINMWIKTIININNIAVEICTYSMAGWGTRIVKYIYIGFDQASIDAMV